MCVLSDGHYSIRLALCCSRHWIASGRGGMVIKYANNMASTSQQDTPQMICLANHISSMPVSLCEINFVLILSIYYGLKWYNVGSKLQLVEVCPGCKVSSSAILLTRPVISIFFVCVPMVHHWRIMLLQTSGKQHWFTYFHNLAM